MDLVIEPIAAICKSRADENRLRTVLAIGGKKKSVSQVVEGTGVSQSLVSHHFKELRRCQLITVDVTAGISLPSSSKAVTQSRGEAIWKH